MGNKEGEKMDKDIYCYRRFNIFIKLFVLFFSLCEEILQPPPLGPDIF